MEAAAALFDLEAITPPPPKQRRLQTVRICMVKESSPLYQERFVDPAMIPPMFDTLFPDLDREIFAAFILDGKNRVVSVYTVSIGSLNQSIVHPRECFKAAILANAAAVILAHNHPTGDPTPSREDIAITRRLREAGDILGIKVLDHVIIGDNGQYYSFVSAGLI